MDSNRMCRTCMRKSCDLIPIYDIQFANGSCSTTIPSLIEFCFKLTVRKNDGLPQNICILCMQMLKHIFDFKLKCYKSTQTVMMLLGGNYQRSNTSSVQAMDAFRKQNVDSTPVKQLPQQVQQSCQAPYRDHDYAKNQSSAVKGAAVQEETCEKGAFFSVKPSFYRIVKRVRNSVNCCKYQGLSGEESNSHTEFEHPPSYEPRSDEDKIEEKCKTRSTQTDAVFEPPVAPAPVTDELNLFRCPACAKTHKDSKCMAKHIVDKHTKKQTCLVCNSKEIRYIRAHCFSHLSKNYFCVNCEKRFILKRQLRFHTKMASKECFQCDTCDERFCLKKDYNWHMEKHEVEENNPKEIVECCGRTFLSADEYKKHKNHSHTQQLFTCDVCSQTFTTREDLVKDQIKHRRDKKVISPCTICKRIFKSVDALAYHVQKVHDDTEDKDEITRRRCNICFYVSSSKSALYNHKKTHTSARKFQCKICQREYSRKKQLQFHIEAFHNNLRRYECKLCEKTFKYHPNLITHYSTKMHKENTKNTTVSSS